VRLGGGIEKISIRGSGFDDAATGVWKCANVSSNFKFKSSRADTVETVKSKNLSLWAEKASVFVSKEPIRSIKAFKMVIIWVSKGETSGKVGGGGTKTTGGLGGLGG
jgi:hypothetical protein